jgi:hypothetical protein
MLLLLLSSCPCFVERDLLTRNLMQAVPGQFVAIRCGGEGEQASQPAISRLYALASSPYAVHRESADLDASIIEVGGRRPPRPGPPPPPFPRPALPLSVVCVSN